MKKRNMIHQQNKAVIFAILAAALYAISSPCSKLLLEHVSATMMAGLLYLGAGIGLEIVSLMQRARGRSRREPPLTKKELPFTIAMIVLDMLAPICLMTGLNTTTAANAALLNNFEIVATTLIALMVFKETVSRRLWLAIGLVTLASMMLSFEDMTSLTFSAGSLLVLLACALWGLENNCTRMLSRKDPKQIVVLKGFGSGVGSLMIALGRGEQLPQLRYALLTMALGFVAYGLSIYFYVYAQRDLGAAKTSTYYAVAPFIGAALSLLILHETPGFVYFAALLMMAVGAWLASTDRPACRQNGQKRKTTIA